MKESWERFVSGFDAPINTTIGVHPIILRSWLRSRDNFQINFDCITHDDILPLHKLQERCEEHEPLLRSARQVIPRLLQLFHDLHCVLLICDSEGYILEAIGDPTFMTRAQTVSLAPGACWREDVKGTNAIGTALVENTPVKILGSHHYVAENHFLNCWAAPIYDPNGAVAGILDISSNSSNGTRSLHELVLLGSQMITQNMRLYQLQKNTFFNKPLRQKITEASNQPHQNPERISGTMIDNRLGSHSYTSAPPFTSSVNMGVQLPWLGRSKVTKEIHELVGKAARSDVSVLLQGESGVGKEVIARSIHQLSSRQKEPFVALNCAALPSSLAQSELFGYVDGAFTGAKKGGQAGKFEQANGGTIFLDEIGDMPADLQVVLLRVLQEKEIIRIGDNRTRKLDFRVIAATHQNLKALVDAGQFRLDLYYRLKVVTINLPPLRERIEDLWDLVPYFVGKASQSLGKPPCGVSGDVYEHLFQHNWPGNIRELENCLTAMVALATEPVLSTYDLPQELLHASSYFPQISEPLLSSLTKKAILDALQQTNGKIAPAAKLLGIGRSTLYRKLEELNLRYP